MNSSSVKILGMDVRGRGMRRFGVARAPKRARSRRVQQAAPGLARGAGRAGQASRFTREEKVVMKEVAAWSVTEPYLVSIDVLEQFVRLLEREDAVFLKCPIRRLAHAVFFAVAAVSVKYPCLGTASREFDRYIECVDAFDAFYLRLRQGKAGRRLGILAAIGKARERFKQLKETAVAAVELKARLEEIARLGGVVRQVRKAKSESLFNADRDESAKRTRLTRGQGISEISFDENRDKVWEATNPTRWQKACDWIENVQARYDAGEPIGPPIAERWW